MAESEFVQVDPTERRARAALLRHEASVRYATERSLDTGHRFALDALLGLIDARAALLCEWDGAAFARRVLAGADVDTDIVDERVSVVRRPLLGLDHLAEPSDEVVRIVSASARQLDVGDLLGDRADELVIAVAGPSARPPTCVIVLDGLDARSLDADLSFIVRDFTLMIMGVMIIESVDRQRRRADDRRVAAMEALVDEVDAERRRIGHEIHDDVLQSVTSIAHFLETLTANAASERDRDVLERLRGEAQNAAITLRKVVNRFEPAQHRDEQLSAQIRQLTDKVGRELDIVASVELDDGVDDLPIAQPIMRVVRQALDNIVTHADASRVDLSLTIDRDARLSVIDDGIGIEQHAPWTNGVGMRSMRNVVFDHGGRFEVRSPANGGTELVATFPMRQLPSPSTLSGDGTTVDDDIVGRAHGATLALLEQGRHVTISAVAGLAGIDRRMLLSRYPTAQELLDEAEADLVTSVLERWAAFDPIDVETSLENRIDLLLDRRFEMEVWGRPTRNRTTPVDPTLRFDTEALAAFAPELEAMTPTNRENRGHVVAWLLRTRSIRAFLGEATDPVIVRSSLRFVAMALLSNDP